MRYLILTWMLWGCTSASTPKPDDSAGGSLDSDDTGEAYTWWSNRGQAYAKNVGWRIDYQIATPGIAATARRASIFKDIKFSDHAPLTIDYDTKPHW